MTGAVALSDSSAKDLFGLTMIENIVVVGKGISVPIEIVLNGEIFDSKNVIFDADRDALTFSSLGISITNSFSLAWK